MHLVDYGDIIRRITEEGFVQREPERFVINAQVLRELGENVIYHDAHGEEFINTWVTIFGEPVASDCTISAESAERIRDLLEANSTFRPVMLPLSTFESLNEEGVRGAGVWYPPIIAPTYEFRNMFVNIESDECAYNKDIVPFTEDELIILLTE